MSRNYENAVKAEKEGGGKEISLSVAESSPLSSVGGEEDSLGKESRVRDYVTVDLTTDERCNEGKRKKKELLEINVHVVESGSRHQHSVVVEDWDTKTPNRRSRSAGFVCRILRSSFTETNMGPPGLAQKGFLFSIACFVIYVLVFTNALIPDYIKTCRRTDPQLEQCINSSIESIRSRLIKGIPELDVPPLEPLSLNEITLNRGPDGAKIQASVKNLKVHGPSNFIITSLQTDVKNNQFDFKVLLPNLRFKGDYTMNMRILLLALQGKGVITGNLTNYKAEVKMKGDKIERNGKKYLHMRKMKTKLDVGDVNLHLSNLFNGDPVLGPATNRILNSNSRLFLEEIQPALESSISEVFTDIANRITLKFTYDELFP